MKKLFIIFVVFHSITVLYAKLQKIEAELKKSEINYSIINNQIDALNEDSNKTEKLDFLERVIRVLRKKRESGKLDVLKTAYIKYANIVIGDEEKSNSKDYLLKKLLETKLNLNDKSYLLPSSIYRMGVSEKLFGMVNNDTYKYFMKNYYLLNSHDKRVLNSRFVVDVTDKGIIEHYNNILSKGDSDEKGSALCGLTLIKSTRDFSSVIKYFWEHLEEPEFNSAIVYYLVRCGYRDNQIYSMLDKLAHNQNELIQKRILLSSFLISNRKIVKYLQSWKKEDNLGKRAKQVLDKIMRLEKKSKQ